MMVGNPLVSIYIPTFNRKNLLERAVLSVLSQSYKNIEVIIVDDGSTDGTVGFLKTLSNKDGRVSFLEKKDFTKKRGACASRNIAIKNSKGVFVTGLDDDDYFHKDRIKYLLASYNDSYSCVSSNSFIISNGKVRRNSYVPRIVKFNDMLLGNVLGQVLVKRHRIIEAGLFDESLKASQDIDMWLRLIFKYGAAKRVCKPLYYIDASHENNRISTSESRIVGTEQFIEKYKDLMPSQYVKFKNDVMGKSKIERIGKIGALRRYGIKVYAELVRRKLKIG